MVVASVEIVRFSVYPEHVFVDGYIVRNKCWVCIMI